jgi:methylaspartate mutase epsilon subunit
MGSLLQDVAAAHVIREVCEAYLAKFGFDDAVVTIDRKSWGGRYPEDEAAAFGLTCYDTVVGMVAGVNEFITKSVQEAVGIPTQQSNAATLRSMRMVIGLMSSQRVPLDPKVLELERQMMRAEIGALIDAVLELGEGDVAASIPLAFEAGVLDVPFAATRNCKGLVMVARDNTGAVRYVDPGAMPIPAAVLEYHRECLARRTDGAEISYRDIVDDIFSISRGYLVQPSQSKPVSIVPA